MGHTRAKSSDLHTQSSKARPCLVSLLDMKTFIILLVLGTLAYAKPSESFGNKIKEAGSDIFSESPQEGPNEVFSLKKDKPNTLRWRCYSYTSRFCYVWYYNRRWWCGRYAYIRWYRCYWY